MKEELVSIIMPSFNSAEFISYSVDSVLNQTYKNWELIISDDCSSDNTIQIVEKFQLNDNRISIIKSRTNSGSAIARNKAIEIANGRYIAFLDSDDLWTQDKLTKQISFMQKKSAALSYGLYETISEDGSVLSPVKKLPDVVTYKELLKNQVIGCLTAVYDTQLCSKQKLPVIRKSEDFALWLKILKQGHCAYCVQEKIGQYRIRDGSVSSNKLKALKHTWIVYRTIEKLPLLKSMRVLLSYIFHRLKRF